MRQVTVNSLLAVLVLAGVGAAEPTGTPTEQYFDAHTQGSAKAKLMFMVPGAVAVVKVKDGDRVTKGQALVQLDDRGERALLAAQRLEADSTLKIEAAQAELQQKTLELDRKERLLKEVASSEKEVEEARVAVLIAKLQVRIEEQTKAQKTHEADRQGIRVDEMTLKSPIDGEVERVELSLGESPESGRAAVSIVQNNPLWVNVNIPSRLTTGLKTGDKLEVEIKDTGKTVPGTLIFLAPVADAASETRLVRLEVANPTGMPSGLGVRVKAPATPGIAPAADAGR